MNFTTDEERFQVYRYFKVDLESLENNTYDWCEIGVDMGIDDLYENLYEYIQNEHPIKIRKNYRNENGWVDQQTYQKHVDEYHRKIKSFENVMKVRLIKKRVDQARRRMIKNQLPFENKIEKADEVKIWDDITSMKTHIRGKEREITREYPIQEQMDFFHENFVNEKEEDEFEDEMDSDYEKFIKKPFDDIKDVQPQFERNERYKDEREIEYEKKRDDPNLQITFDEKKFHEEFERRKREDEEVMFNKSMGKTIEEIMKDREIALEDKNVNTKFNVKAYDPKYGLWP